MGDELSLVVPSPKDHEQDATFASGSELASSNATVEPAVGEEGYHE